MENSYLCWITFLEWIPGNKITRPKGTNIFNVPDAYWQIAFHKNYTDSPSCNELVRVPVLQHPLSSQICPMSANLKVKKNGNFCLE